MSIALATTAAGPGLLPSAPLSRQNGGVIRIGVVEDEARARDEVLGYLARYAHDRAVEFQARSFADGAELVARYQHDLDLIFLDIEMKQLDGMSAARKIRQVDGEVIIVFITNSPHHAISGYSVGALSYLLKPVAYGAFAQELDRSLAQLSRRERRSVLLTTPAGEKRRVDVGAISYMESSKHRITVHADGQMYAAPGPLKTLEEQFVPLGFYRINNCYLVNLSHVVGVRDPDVLLRGGISLPASRKRKQGFLDALSGYVGGPARVP
jgi:DNA-binding LytR/AlgR family response regulator